MAEVNYLDSTRFDKISDGITKVGDAIVDDLKTRATVAINAGAEGVKITKEQFKNAAETSLETDKKYAQTVTDTVKTMSKNSKDMVEEYRKNGIEAAGAIAENPTVGNIFAQGIKAASKSVEAALKSNAKNVVAVGMLPGKMLDVKADGIAAQLKNIGNSAFKRIENGANAMGTVWGKRIENAQKALGPELNKAKEIVEGVMGFNNSPVSRAPAMALKPKQ